MSEQIPLLEFLHKRYFPSKPGLNARSREQYDVAIRRFVEWHGNGLTLDKLSEPLLTAFLADYAEHHCAATVNSKRQVTLTLWESAASDFGIVESPNRRRVPKMPEPERLPEAWTTAEVERLVKTCRSLSGAVGEILARHWWSSLVLAIYATGSRVSAMRSVTTADCDLAERYLIVRAEAQKSKRDRLFWLTDQAVAAIASHYDCHRKLVWPHPYRRKWLWDAFRRIVESAGLRSSRRGMDLFHKLRRTNVSYIAAEGGLEMAREQAGHTSAWLTRKHYIDPRIAKERSTVDLLPKLNLKLEQDAQQRGEVW